MVTSQLPICTTSAAVDIGGSGARFWARTAVPDGSGFMLTRSASVLWNANATSLASDLVTLRALLSKVSLLPAHVGNMVVSFPGAITASGLVSRWPNRPHWVGFDLVGLMRDALPSFEFTILDDAVCAALGFIGEDPAADCCGLLYVGIGTGIGGAHVPPDAMRGPLTPSTVDLVRSVELGHQIIGGEALCSCGRNGCVQAYARAGSLTGRPTHEREIATRAIATAVVNLAEVLPIDLVMLGGGALCTVDDLGRCLQEAVTGLARSGSRPIRVSVSRAPEQASLTGARLLAISLRQSSAPMSSESIQRSTINLGGHL